MLTSVHVQEQDEQNHAKQLKNYISETTEELEGFVIVLLFKITISFLDAISKKGTFNDFFAKIFKYVNSKTEHNILLAGQRMPGYVKFLNY